MITINKEFFREEDKEQIQKLFEFCSNLVIIDKDLANSLETSKSNYAASEYITAYYNTSDYDEETRARVLANYEEYNDYYKALKLQYDIEPAVARESKHLTILKANSNALSQSEEELFYDCYYESLNYYNNVIGTKAFNFHDRYPNFTKVFLIWSAIQKYISKSMDSLFNIDTYDEKTLKNAFISLGLDYFDGMPINYKRTLLKKINDIISSKGSTECFIDIMEVFGEKTVDINNYYLVKKHVKVVDEDGNISYQPSLEFYKTPFNKKLDMDSDEYFSFEEITANDKYWKATREEILNKEFNIIKTNYLSISSAIDIYKNSLQFSYFFNFLEKAIADKKLTNTDIYYSRISSTPFSLHHAFVALISLGMKLNGYKDTIVKDVDVSNYVYGYSQNTDYVKLNELLYTIENEVLNNDQMLLDEKNDLLAFIRKFKIEKLTNKSYTLKDFLQSFYKNESIRTKLEELISNTNNYYILDSLKKIRDLEMRTMTNANLFKGFSTYSEFLKYNNLSLYNYIQLPNNYSSNEELYLIIKEKMNDLIAAINGQLYNESLEESITKNTFMGINNYLDYYIRTLVHLFKPYSLEIINADNYYNYNSKNENVKLYDRFEKYLIKTEAEYVGFNERIEIYKGDEKIL